jgi:nucleotide-binding universal stress UspA family protein
MNATAIRSWWSAGMKDVRALFAPGPAARKTDSPEIGGRSDQSQTSFWSDFSRQPDETISHEKPGRAVKPLNILVPTDFAPASLLALDCALRMAARQPSRVTLLHAIHLNLRRYGPANVDRIKTELCREALAKAQPILVSARELGVTAYCMLEEGSPAGVIANAAQRCPPDLVIMANSRRGFFARLFGRGTVKRVVRSLSCPVLVLPLVG